jgi:hypothetical protein
MESGGSRPRITWLDTMRFTVVYNSLQQFITWLDYTIRRPPAIYPAGNGGSRPRITWLDYMAVYRGVPLCILHGTRQFTRYPAMLHRSSHVMAGGPEGSDGIWQFTAGYSRSQQSIPVYSSLQQFTTVYSSYSSSQQFIAVCSSSQQFAAVYSSL